MKNIINLPLTLVIALNLVACAQDPVTVPMTGASEVEDCDTGEECDEETAESSDTGDTGETETETETEPEEETETETDNDLDNDGYTADQDCDETDPNVNPGALEVCGDDIDNDCNGLTDSEEEHLDCDGDYEDLDGDGMTGLVDCDDTNPDINPLAVEVEDGVDNDCDGDIDEGFESEETDEDPDSDGDGYTASIDCDDTNANVYPGAEELDNEIDDDCDDEIDEGFDGDTDDEEYDDADGDGYTSEIDCDDSDPSIYPGAEEESNTDGIDQDCDGTEEETETETETYSVKVEATFEEAAFLTLSVHTWDDGAFENIEDNVWSVSYDTGEQRIDECIEAGGDEDECEDDYEDYEDDEIVLHLEESSYPLSCGVRINVDVDGTEWVCEAGGFNDNFDHLDIWTEETGWLDTDDLRTSDNTTGLIRTWVAASNGSCSLFVQTDDDEDCNPVDYDGDESE